MTWPPAWFEGNLFLLVDGNHSKLFNQLILHSLFQDGTDLAPSREGFKGFIHFVKS